MFLYKVIDINGFNVDATNYDYAHRVAAVTQYIENGTHSTGFVLCQRASTVLWYVAGTGTTLASSR